MEHKLMRSETDKVFTGLCGGLAEYYNISSTSIRILMVILFLFFPGLNIIFFLMYLAAAYFVPKKPYYK